MGGRGHGAAVRALPRRAHVAGPKCASAFGIAVAVGIMVAPSQAFAYRTFSDDPSVGRAARQVGDDVAWDLAAPDPTASDLGEFEAAAMAAFESWTSTSCSSLLAHYEGRSSQIASPGDGRSTIELVRSGWEARGFPTGRGATTDVQLRTLGSQVEISEADIYVNLADFTFSSDGTTDTLDREGVLLHEIGHLLGLLHPCEFADPTAPSCAATPAAATSALYPTYSGVRTLSSDDVAGVCALYPAAGCPLACTIGFACVSGACAACVNPTCDAPTCPGPDCSPPTCAADGTCAVGTCSRYGEQAGQCVAAGAFGAACASANECASRLCLQRSRDSFCTAMCTDDADCPGLTRCVDLAGRTVCQPVASTGGCTTAGRGTRPGCAAVATGAALLLGAIGRRRVRRRRR